MSGPYDLSDDRLAQAFREVFQMKAEFDLAEEVRKANLGARIADDCFCKCGARGYRSLCPACQREANQAGR